MQRFLDNFQTKRTKKSKQIGQEKVAVTITGAGVVARKLTFSNNISELLDGAPPAPRWLFDYFTVTSDVAGLSRTPLVHWSWVDRTGDTVTVKQSQRRVTSPTSKMFRQQLDCTKTCRNNLRIFLFLFTQSEKFLDLGTVTRPPSNIYARVNCSVIRDRCTRVQGHPRNLFQRPWIFGLSSQKHHTWPYHASVLWYTEANFSFQMQQREFPRPYLRNDTMDFHF